MWEIFEKLCKERGVSVYRVCEATGIKTSAMSAWKNGRYKFKQEKLMKIAEFFGVPVEYLVTGEMPEKAEQYYDPESKAIVQDLHDREDLRALLHVAKKSSPEYVDFVRNFLQMQLEKEGK